MPYIVTTKREIPTGVTRDFDTGAWECDDVVESVSRRAVATLEKAREAVWAILLEGCKPGDPVVAWAGRAMPESGGTIGPLPDGTVIEVRSLSWLEFAAEALALDVPEATRVGSPLIDAYNASQS